MEVKVDEGLCTACGLCLDICPDVFEMGEDVALIKANPVPPDAEESCQEAADGCPVEAISIK